MRLRSARRAVITARTRDPVLEAWANDIVADGGTVSETRANIVEAFIARGRVSGAFYLTDDYWLLWGEDAGVLGPQTLTSLKQRRLATPIGAPTGTNNRGIAFNGSTQCLDTGHNPALHAVAQSLNSTRSGIYERTDFASTAIASGASGSNNRSITLRPRTTGSTAQGSAGSASGSFTLPSADSRGFFACSRNGTLATDVNAYKRGVLLTRTVDPSGMAASILSAPIYIGANNNGGATSFRASSIGFYCIGAALSADQEAAEAAAVQELAVAVGAEV